MTWQQGLLIAAVIGLFLAAQWVGKKRSEDSRSARLMKRYEHMTADLLAQTADDDLVDAVVSRVLAKAAQARRPDPVATLATLEHASTVVYSVWAVCKEMAAGDYDSLCASPARELLEPAQSAFEVIGAPACAQALAALIAAPDEDTQAAFRLAVQTECPLSLCVPYIRDHAEEFCDDTPMAD